MTKVLALYFSTCGHIETMAESVAEGVRSTGAVADVKRVPELVPEDAARAAHFKLDQKAPVASVVDLPGYAAIIFGTPTRFGMMASQMRSFLDQTCKLWMQGALVGKVGSVFAASATQHGAAEATILSFHTTLLHHGMVIVGLPYSFQGRTTLAEIAGGSPYDATTIAAGDGARQPSAIELDGARHQGAHVAQTAAKLSA